MTPEKRQRRLRKAIRWLVLLSVAAFTGVVMIATAAYLYLAPLLPAAETYRSERCRV